jgi:hypothetical protein
MVTLAMFLLVIMTVVSADRMLMENSEAKLATQTLASSSLIASDLFQEIISKPFDQRVVIDTTEATWRQDTTGTKVTVTSNLSAYGGAQWGVRSLVTLPDSSYRGNYRSMTALKDVDDYDGYRRIVPYTATTFFDVKVRIYYVTISAPDVLTSTPQFLKKVELTVKLPQDTSKVIYSTLAAY